MAPFKVVKTVCGTSLRITIIGKIDENSDFCESLQNFRNLILDLGQVSYINSYGIRSWLNWIRTFPSDLEIEIIDCPPVIVNKLSSVALFPPGCKVRSVVVPYYCDRCPSEAYESFNILDVQNGTVHTSKKCSGCGGNADLDILIENYSQLLNISRIETRKRAAG